MPLVVLPQFLEGAEALSKELRGKLLRILGMLSRDVRHPGLRTKKIKGTGGSVYECRVDDSVRLIYDRAQDSLRCWYVGKHDAAIRIAREGLSREIIVDDVEIEAASEDLLAVMAFLTDGDLPSDFRETTWDLLEPRTDG